MSASPKKSAGGVKKKPAKPISDEGTLSLFEQNQLLQREIETLKLQLIRESNKSTAAELVVKELRGKFNDLQQAHAQEKQRCFDISIDMTRQYKSMREELIKKINSCEDQILLLNDKIQQQKLEYADMERRKDAQLASKQSEINEQKQKMDEMATEFGVMLKQTLDKMSEKITITNEWETNNNNNSSDQPVVRTFEDFNLINN